MWVCVYWRRWRVPRASSPSSTRCWATRTCWRYEYGVQVSHMDTMDSTLLPSQDLSPSRFSVQRPAGHGWRLLHTARAVGARRGTPTTSTATVRLSVCPLSSAQVVTPSRSPSCGPASLSSATSTAAPPSPTACQGGAAMSATTISAWSAHSKWCQPRRTSAMRPLPREGRPYRGRRHRPQLVTGSAGARRLPWAGSARRRRGRRP